MNGVEKKAIEKFSGEVLQASDESLLGLDEFEIKIALGDYENDFIEEVFAGNINMSGINRKDWVSLGLGTDEGFQPILKDGKVAKHEIYNAMSYYIERNLVRDEVLQEADELAGGGFLPADAAKLFINLSLKDMGFDGITHAG